MSGKQKKAFAEKMHKHFSLLFTRFDSEQKKIDAPTNSFELINQTFCYSFLFAST